MIFLCRFTGAQLEELSYHTSLKGEVGFRVSGVEDGLGGSGHML